MLTTVLTILACLLFFGMAWKGLTDLGILALVCVVAILLIQTIDVSFIGIDHVIQAINHVGG